MSATTEVASTMLDHRRKVLLSLVSACRNHERGRAKQAIEALRRIEEGSYGYCTLCGLRIPEAVLERRPERNRCTACAGD